LGTAPTERARRRGHGRGSGRVVSHGLSSPRVIQVQGSHQSSGSGGISAVDTRGSSPRFDARASPSRALRDVTDHSSFRLRQLTHQAFDRIDQDSPLRFRPHDTEGMKLRFQDWRDPKTDLRIILDFLAGIGPRRRTACPASCLSTLGHSAQQPVCPGCAVFVTPTIHGYNSFTCLESASAGRLESSEENRAGGVPSFTAMNGPRYRSFYLTDRSSGLTPPPRSFERTLATP